MPTTRERIAAAATEHGWVLTRQRRGADSYRRGLYLTFVEFTATGSVNAAAVQKFSSPSTGMGSKHRVSGADRLGQVLTILSTPEVEDEKVCSPMAGIHADPHRGCVLP